MPAHFWTMKTGTDVDSEGTFILGHRGFRGPLENTLPAFRRALMYADGVEFDVRVTGDGRLVAHHDPGFKTDGSLHLVRELSLRELRRLHPMGKLIPTVERVFREFRGAIFNADVKEPQAVDPLLRITERNESLDRTVFSSEDLRVIRVLLQECPDCRVGFSIVGYGSVFWIPRLRNIYSVHVPIDVVSYIGYRPFTIFLRAIRRRGLRIYLWNYRMDELLWVPRLVHLVDALISDDPARVKKSFYGRDVFFRGDTNGRLGIR